jgi:hypothetical protein
MTVSQLVHGQFFAMLVEQAHAFLGSSHACLVVRTHVPVGSQLECELSAPEHFLLLR